MYGYKTQAAFTYQEAEATAHLTELYYHQLYLICSGRLQTQTFLFTSASNYHCLTITKTKAFKQWSKGPQGPSLGLQKSKGLVCGCQQSDHPACQNPIQFFKVQFTTVFSNLQILLAHMNLWIPKKRETCKQSPLLGRLTVQSLENTLGIWLKHNLTPCRRPPVLMGIPVLGGILLQIPSPHST